MGRTVIWRPNPGPQTEVLTRREREVCAGGARVGGKTEAGIIFMIREPYISNEKYAGLVIRRNANDLTNWIERAKRIYGEIGGVHTGNPGMFRFPGDAYIMLGHLADDEAYERYQGHEYQLMNVEELTHIPNELRYLRLISSCRSTVPGLDPQIYSSCNPLGPGHTWVKRRFVDVAYGKTYIEGYDVSGKPLARIFIPMKAEDCPQIWENDPAYVRMLESLPDRQRRAWRYGEWELPTGMFFEDWNPVVHVIKPQSVYGMTHFRGLDWGYNDYAACVWVAVDTDGTHYVYREYYRKGRTPTQVAQDILGMTPPNENIATTFADPSIWAKNQYASGQHITQSTMQSIASMMMSVGLYVQQANNDRISGWQRIKDLLSYDYNRQPKIKVFENCENLIRVIPEMQYYDTSKKQHETKVEDMVSENCEDHLPDALRYLCMHTWKPSVATQKPSQGSYERIFYDIYPEIWEEAVEDAVMEKNVC